MAGSRHRVPLFLFAGFVLSILGRAGEARVPADDGPGTIRLVDLLDVATIDGPLVEIEAAASLDDLGDLQRDPMLDEDFTEFDAREAGWSQSPAAEVVEVDGGRSFVLHRMGRAASYGWVFPVEPGEHYVFRRRIRCERAPDADFAVVEAKKSGRIGLRGPFDNHYMAGRGLALKIHWPDPPDANGEWQEGSVSFFTTPQTRALAVMMRPTLSPQSATQREVDAWFDDIQLVRVTPTHEQRIALLKSQSLAEGADPALGVHKHGQFPPLGEVGDSHGPGDDNYSYREALYAPAPTDLAFPLRIPEQASLRFGVALSRETHAGDAARFEVLVRDGAEEHALWGAEVAAVGEGWCWHEQRLELAAFGGREIELVLRTSAVEGHPQAVWGSPMIDRPPSGTGPRNVILIAVDTLRADRLGCYGYERDTTPNLDALAADGVRFDQATSNCNWTCPSFASIFTGVVPSRHGVFSYGPRTPLPDELLTLAEHFRAAGWPTQAIAYKPPLYDGNFEQGYDVAFNVPRENVRGADNLHEALEWLETNADRRNFLFLHFNDPHQPFTQPAPFDRKFGSDPAEHGLELPLSMYGGGLPRGEEGRVIVRDLYDGAVAYVDDRIGVFLDALREKGLYEDSVIAFVADHGEQLWEHGGFGHGPTFSVDANLLFDEVVHVPLIVKPAGARVGKVVNSQVRGFDVMPTLLELAGLPVEKGLDAASLVPLLDPAMTESEDRIAVIETSSRALALRNRDWKYILDYSRRARESLFDLQADPGEKHDVADARPEMLATMRQCAMEYVLLHRPGQYLIATGEGGATASIEVDGARSAVSLFGLPSRPREGGGLSFAGAPSAGLWVVAELEASGFPTIAGQPAPEELPRYATGQLAAMLGSGESQAVLVAGPPRIAPASRARRTMDARQLEALKALGYIDDGEGPSVGNDDGEVEEVSLRSAEEEGIAIGERLGSSGSLRDLRGNRRSLADFAGHQALVVLFLGTECPLANLYVPRLIQLSEQYAARGVRFLGVYPHESESLPEIAAHASDRDLPFLIVKDFGQQLADRLGIERTPAAAVLDAEGALRYRGRIDDQYSVAARRKAPQRQELAEAIDQVLAGEAVETVETDEDGCLLDRALNEDPGEPVSFTRDVAPILQARCEVCHRDGQIGGFSLTSYEDAKRRRRMLREVVVQRRMPPWHADARYGHFANDRSLSEGEIDVLRRWVDQGAPRGDAADLPPSREWSGDWNLGEPDLVLQAPRAIDVPADGFMDYLYMTTETDFEEDVWVQAAEIRPGDPSVLHHVLVYIRPPGSGRRFDRTTMALVNWVPGTMPKRNPEGSATRIPKGATLLWELHYTPNGTATSDRTSMALKFADAPPRLETKFSIWANWRIAIPPFERHHEERASLRIREDTHLVSFRPHMHVRGKSWRYEVDYPDGRTETLLHVPNWDFNWQTEYSLAEPLPLPTGSVLRSISRWDNSDENPLNPDPSQRVRYGLQTDEEMMNGWVKLASIRRDGEPSPAANPGEVVPQSVFDRVDLD